MALLLNDFLDRGIIRPSQHELTEFISPVFLREKKNGSFRLILNLKEFNKFVAPYHFKMDNIETCICLMKQNCFMASIDLSDAYFSVPIHTDHQKYFKFLWKGKLYQFTCLAQGLSSAPRMFTKLLKPMYSVLRQQGHVSSAYLDDSFLEGDTFESCKSNALDTLDILENLGFCPNYAKSVITPTQMLEHLGFVLNSKDMTVGITQRNYQKLHAIANTVLSVNSTPIRQVARLVGIMVSSFPGVEYGRLYYRQLEIEKSIALKSSCWNFESHMTLSDKAKSDILWWLENALFDKRKINHGVILKEIRTDASNLGWGAFCEGVSTGGRWSPAESKLHINALELLAVSLGLKALFDKDMNCHIKVLSDNTTTVAYLRNMGGSHSDNCNNITRTIWEWCKCRSIWITPAHIPGAKNIEADLASRVFNDQTEWKLDHSILSNVFDLFGKPNIDLFASRLNHQLPLYVSWIPDPNAMSVDAFTLEWTNDYYYSFPPFSLVARVLQKIEKDQAEMLLICPHWTTQSWFPKLLRLLVQDPVLLPAQQQIVFLPFNMEREHPLKDHLQLMACRLSGKALQTRAYQKELKKSSFNLGDKGLRNNIKYTYTSGNYFAVDGMLIPFNPL